MNIATVGDNCMDVYAVGNRAFPGGNPVNVAVYTIRLGGKASYVGAVGTDSYGALMKEALAEKKIDISHVHTLPGATAITQVTLKDGDRIMGDYDEGVLANFRLSESDIDFLCGHDIVHTGLWGKIERDLCRIHSRGVLVSFDFATAQDGPVIDTALPYVDYAFFSRQEDGAELRAFMKAVAVRGPKLVVVTLGASGSLVWDGVAFSTYGIIPTALVDTLGAGDSYIAGFLCGLMGKQSLTQCMRVGAENAAVTLSYMGAW